MPRKSPPPAKKLTIEEKQKLNLIKHRMRLAAKKERLAKRSEENFYCKNKQLLEELEKWRDSNLEEEKGLSPDEIDYTRRTISPELCKMVMYIAKKLTNHSNFVRYPQDLKDEMISAAVTKIFTKGKGLSNYNFAFSNPFSYFTTAIYNTFLIVLRDHYKHINIKKELIKRAFGDMESNKLINPKALANDFIKQWLGDEQKENPDETLKKKPKRPFGRKN